MTPVTGSPEFGLVLTHDGLGSRAEDAVDRAGVTEAGLKHALEHGHHRPERSGLERRRRLAVRVDMAPCDRTDDAVHHQPVRLLEVLHGVLRLRSEDPVDVVGPQDLRAGEDPLKSLHVVPGVAQLDGRWHLDPAVVLLLAPL